MVLLPVPARPLVGVPRGRAEAAGARDDHLQLLANEGAIQVNVALLIWMDLDQRLHVNCVHPGRQKAKEEGIDNANLVCDVRRRCSTPGRHQRQL